jgi:hypothetical protein
MEKIRIGIDLDHVIRDINRQIVKFYQRDFDETIEVDEVNMKGDVLNEVCHFSSKKELYEFLYENYSLELYGHANQIKRTLSRDLNQWLYNLTNQEDFDVDVFFFSMKEYNLTIQSTYFFLSKIGSRVRKMIFPKTEDELMEYGDIFITADSDVVRKSKECGKGAIVVKMDFNEDVRSEADWVVEDFNEFLECDDKLTKINYILNNKETCKKKKLECSFLTSTLSWISSLIRRKKGAVM